MIYPVNSTLNKLLDFIVGDAGIGRIATTCWADLTCMDILNRPVSEINATIALAPRATYESALIQRSQTQMGHQAQRQLSAWPPAGMGSRVGFATVETATTRKAGLQAGPRPRPMLPDQHPSGRERPSGRHTSKLPRPEELFLSRLALDRHAADIANRRMLPRWPESKEFLVRDWQAAPPGRQKRATLDTFGASFI